MQSHRIVIEVIRAGEKKPAISSRGTGANIRRIDRGDRLASREQFPDRGEPRTTQPNDAGIDLDVGRQHGKRRPLAVLPDRHVRRIRHRITDIVSPPGAMRKIPVRSASTPTAASINGSRSRSYSEGAHGRVMCGATPRHSIGCRSGPKAIFCGTEKRHPLPRGKVFG